MTAVMFISSKAIFLALGLSLLLIGPLLGTAVYQLFYNQIKSILDMDMRQEVFPLIAAGCFLFFVTRYLITESNTWRSRSIPTALILVDAITAPLVAFLAVGATILQLRDDNPNTLPPKGFITLLPQKLSYAPPAIIASLVLVAVCFSATARVYAIGVCGVIALAAWQDIRKVSACMSSYAVTYSIAFPVALYAAVTSVHNIWINERTHGQRGQLALCFVGFVTSLVLFFVTESERPSQEALEPMLKVALPIALYLRVAGRVEWSTVLEHLPEFEPETKLVDITTTNSNNKTNNTNNNNNNNNNNKKPRQELVRTQSFHEIADYEDSLAGRFSLLALFLLCGGIQLGCVASNRNDLCIRYQTALGLKLEFHFGVVYTFVCVMPFFGKRFFWFAALLAAASHIGMLWLVIQGEIRLLWLGWRLPGFPMDGSVALCVHTISCIVLLLSFLKYGHQ